MTRYTPGGDEHLFVEVSEEMSLSAFFTSMLLTNRLKELRLEGIREICPANASFQIRFDPDVIDIVSLQAELEKIEADLGPVDAELTTRIVEIPVLYDDPWTNETVMRFRDRHQNPQATDIEYAAQLNGCASVSEFIERHSATPWFVSMVGFVAGLPFLYQMVERSRQIEVPKYVTPRTDTPKQAIGYGGCFTSIYSVRGAGGYQLLGITPVPIYDPEQRYDHLRDFMIFFQPGDIVKFRPIDMSEYEDILHALETNAYQLRTATIDFALREFEADPIGYPAKLLEALHGND